MNKGLTEAEFNLIVGQRIRAARERTKPLMSCDDVGAKIGKHGATIARYESGEVPMMAVIAYQICRVIGLDMRELFK